MGTQSTMVDVDRRARIQRRLDAAYLVVASLQQYGTDQAILDHQNAFKLLLDDVVGTLIEKIDRASSPTRAAMWLDAADTLLASVETSIEEVTQQRCIT